jgi:hypothetical protein
MRTNLLSVQFWKLQNVLIFMFSYFWFLVNPCKLVISGCMELLLFTFSYFCFLG